MSEQTSLYRFPLRQHIGAPSVPAVRAGERVVRGQLLAAAASDALSVPLYTSVAGTVGAVTETEITVAADAAQSADFLPLTGESPAELVRQAGLVGLGGAGFPTYAKLTELGPEGTVIVNAAECEPILNHNIERIERHPAQLLRGLALAMEITKAGRGVVAIKSAHAAAVSALENANADPRVRIHLLPDLYPMGEERAIVREVLGVLLPPEALPAQAGAVVLNAETACRIADAVDFKKPLIDKDLTVAGKLNTDRQAGLIRTFFDVPLGASVEALFRRAGGLREGYGELIMGGPFTGKRTELSAPIIKTTGGLIAAECFPKGPEKIGLLVCACGADQQRLEQLAESLGSRVVGVEFCKQAKAVKAARKCENPGHCPGQVQKVLALKKAGAQAVLISNCTDCSNTVMSCAPRLGLPVYHCTDGALRAVNHKLIRRIKEQIKD